MTESVRRTAELVVPLALADAMAMFTPEGERRWAGDHGWDPHYPDVARTAGVGAVFVTSHQGRETWWVIVDQTPDRIRYVRVTPGGLAGTVEVAATSATAGATTVRVTYDMTALSSDGRGELDAFASRYDDEITSWGQAIEQALGAHRKWPDR